jgi:hypothetical protein
MVAKNTKAAPKKVAAVTAAPKKKAMMVPKKKAMTATKAAPMKEAASNAGEATAKAKRGRPKGSKISKKTKQQNY